jgi:hypothetical protein
MWKDKHRPTDYSFISLHFVQRTLNFCLYWKYAVIAGRKCLSVYVWIPECNVETDCIKYETSGSEEVTNTASVVCSLLYRELIPSALLCYLFIRVYPIILSSPRHLASVCNTTCVLPPIDAARFRTLMDFAVPRICLIPVSSHSTQSFLVERSSSVM